MTGIMIEGEDLQVAPELIDGRRMRLNPGWYVRHEGEILSVADPLRPHRVQDAIAFSHEPRRSLIAVDEAGEPHVIASLTIEIENGPVQPHGFGWKARVILMPTERRPEPIEISLPYPRRSG